jgi:enoyl-CoA hydratase
VLDAYADLATLAVTQQGSVLTVALNRPSRLNAANAAMIGDLRRLFRLLPEDASAAAVLLTGAGRGFSAGGDIRDMAAGDAAHASGASAGATRIANLLAESKDLITAMLDVPQPIVAAVHGYAIGLGATLALCADVVIAAQDAVLSDPHVSMGLVAGDGGAVIWPLLLPINTAKYYLMTGDPITGADAARLGLVLKAVPATDLAAEAQAVAGRLAAGPPLAVRWTKSVLNKILRDRLSLLLDASLALEGASMLSADHAEAVAAFSEGRPPVFKGK